MRFQKRKAVDFNWVTLRIKGVEVKAKKHGFKVARTTQKVTRYGSNVAEARTIGMVNVDDSVIEFDIMAATTILNAFGVTDGNIAKVYLTGQSFEMTEDVRDPDPNPLTGAGGMTNLAKGCEIIGVEWSGEVGENASAMSWTISILDMDIAKGDLGGAGMSLGRG
jgi:hypothetical protein